MPPISDDTRNSILVAAHDLAPRLKERARRAAEARSVPVETIREMQERHLFRILQPARFGGAELDWETLCEVAQILARADGSQAWVLSLMADHAQLIAGFPLRAQEDVWGEDPSTLVSVSIEASGRAKRVAGGFEVSGRHKFASGIDHASWLIFGGLIEENGGELSGHHAFMVRKAQATVIDDWDTLGLEGTGSKSFEVRGVFVPDHRAVDADLARSGRGPGIAVNSGITYRLPRSGITPVIFSALSVGMAKSVLDEWLNFAGPRRAGGVPLEQQHGNLFVAAEAEAEILAAEALYQTTLARATRTLEAGGTLDDLDLAAGRRNAAYAVKLAIAAGHRLFAAGGGHALFNQHHLGRQYRNLLASGAHFGVNWNVHAPAYGRMLLARRLG